MSQDSLPKAAKIKGGPTIILGMTVVIMGLSAFYMNLHRRQASSERLGRTPHYEHLLAHVGGTHNGDAVTLPTSRVEKRIITLDAPQKEHNSKHSTIANYLSSSNYTEAGRREQPTPQRAKDDGSGRAYTKSPNYVQNYEKTARSRKEIGGSGK